MGEVNENPFKDACLKAYPGQGWETRTVELSSLWQAKINNPNWQPFKKMYKNGKYMVCFLFFNNHPFSADYVSCWQRTITLLPSFFCTIKFSLIFLLDPLQLLSSLSLVSV